MLKCGRPCNSSETISQGKRESLKLKSQNWTGLDKFWDVYDNTSWGYGPANYYMHVACYFFTLSSIYHLDRAQLRKQKENDTDNISYSKQSKGDLEGPPFPKVLHSTVGGPLHDKTKFVWCMQGPEDAKQPTRLSASCPGSTQI